MKIAGIIILGGITCGVISERNANMYFDKFVKQSQIKNIMLRTLAFTIGASFGVVITVTTPVIIDVFILKPLIVVLDSTTKMINL